MWWLFFILFLLISVVSSTVLFFSLRRINQYENLILQKSITLTSRALFDDLDGWVGYEDEYVILNDNITGTIIDGSHDINGEGFESTILITSDDDECVSPLIFGFTIQGGSGTVVLIEEDTREEEVNEQLADITYELKRVIK